jgi:anhydro-N-acetylmuramic acid kinase
MATSRDHTEKHVILGCMSGTSLDGIDLAILTTDGVDEIEYGQTYYRAYSDEERDVIRASLGQRAPNDITRVAEQAVTNAHIDAIQKFRAAHNIHFGHIAFHGQTIAHDPAKKFTWQIGDAGALARAINCPVIYDFRGDDVAMGGQGAPLLPVYHRALMMKVGIKLPSAVINIGGVSNITYLSQDDDFIAFDCGAGNALIDDVMKQYFDCAYDKDGAIARAGQIDDSVLNALLNHSFFNAPYPKSLDRNAWDLSCLNNLSPQNRVTTLTAFTVHGVARGINMLPQKPLSIYITGGGRHNKYMMELIANETGIPVHSVDTLGWNGDFMEAQGFAYMAARFLKQLPISFPMTTGAPHPMTGGKIILP